jgi:hypothetical protein
MKQVLAVPRGMLTPKDKERLTKAGVVYLEIDDPAKVRLIETAPAEIPPKGALQAALETLAQDGAHYVAHSFVKRLAKLDAKP